MNPVSKDISTILAAAGLGLVAGTNLFIGEEPTTPANCVTVYDTPGDAPMLTQDRTERYDFPAIQVKVRNTSYLNAQALIEAIKGALHGLAHYGQGGASYELVKCDQDPFSLGKDETGRSMWVCNFSIQRKPL
jgi:hypothetical protein